MDFSILKNIDRVINELPEYAAEILAKDYKRELIDIQQDQLLEGVRGDGKKTQKYKSEAYINSEDKRSTKSFPNRNYHKTGDLFNGMFIEAEGDEVLSGSYDEKTRFLEPQEEDELFGIAPKNIEKIDSLNGFAKKLIKKTGYELSR